MNSLFNRIVCLALLVAATCTSTAAEGSAISSSTTTPAINQSFTVTVAMTATIGYSCWGQVLSWDTSKVRLDSQDAVSSPLGTVVTDSRTLAAIQASGQVRTGGYYEAAGSSYPDHGAVSGAVSTFTFTRIAAGSTTLNCPVKTSGQPFGLVYISAAAAERSPSASSLTLGDSNVTFGTNGNQTVELSANAQLIGTAPNGHAVQWRVKSAPASSACNFPTSGNNDIPVTTTQNPTTALFSHTGTYVLTFTDTTDNSATDVTITVVKNSNGDGTVSKSRVVRIMPLGDSITAESSSGWRWGLQDKLIAGGYQFDFVGGRHLGINGSYDPDHEGHSGWETVNYPFSQEFGWGIDNGGSGNSGYGIDTDGLQPDVVLLMLGTNDAGRGGQTSAQSAARLFQNIDDIYAKVPASRVIVARIPRLSELYGNQPAPSGGVTKAVWIENYNTNISNMVATRVAAGQKLSVVDMYGALGWADLSDGVHPNAAGYAKMAQVWYDGIVAVTSGGGVNLPPTVSLVSAGAPFTAPANVTLNASANDSDGTIAKVEFYNGASKIGEDTTAPYAYSWTNVAAGTYNLSAKATDNQGATTTSSLIIVTVTAGGGGGGNNGASSDSITVNIGSPVMGSDESAGVVPQSHWTTITATTATALVDGSGAATTATHTFSSANWGWAENNQIADVAGDQRMLRGYIDQTLGVNHAINSIPFATYDLYLYFDRDNNTGIGSFVHKFTITDASGTVLAGPFFALDPENTPFTGFVEVPASSTTDLQGTTPAGNYLHITGLTASNIRIDVGASGDSWGQNGFSRSAIGGLQIIRNGALSAVATPTFTPAPGTFSSAQTVTIGCGTAGATVHFTTDGSTPTASSAVYTGAIAVASTTTIQAIATATGLTNSSVVSATYTITIVPPPPGTVATPTFTPTPGTYSAAQSVTIACSTAGAAIHFTTDGSTPTASSAVYSGTIAVASTTTIQAIATASGMNNSSVASATYTITIVPPPPGIVATPTFTPAPGTYGAAQAVTLACSTAGATMHYTTDGSTPTPSSAIYGGAIAVASTTTIRAIATAAGMTNSSIASATYTITIVPPPPGTVATPSFTPAPGTYSAAQEVTIACSTPGATVHFTTDGSLPTASSPVYTGPISVASTTTIQAIATAPGMVSSAVASATFEINQETAGTSNHPFAAPMDQGSGGCGAGNMISLIFVAAMMLGLRNRKALVNAV